MTSVYILTFYFTKLMEIPTMIYKQMVQMGRDWEAYCNALPAVDELMSSVTKTIMKRGGKL